MAKVYISEYVLQPLVRTGQMAGVGSEPNMANQTVAIGGSSTPSSAFNAKTKFIRVHTDAICSIKIGPAATATANDARMAANTTEYFGVNAGDVLACITNT
jgi:hypothetical protein